MKKTGATALSVASGSIAEELGIVAGDAVVAVNGEAIEDYFDYKYLTSEERVELEVRKSDGETVLFDIEKDETEDLGIEFADMLFGTAKSCANRCIFCFIDQLPKGMRETLYFKDDDTRLSFLYGNYVTLTNMKDRDLEKIIRYRISPVNISVHTTNPSLRVKMLRNRRAGEIMERIAQLEAGGIQMNIQIVLCPGVNDASELDRTVCDLAERYPHISSVSIVPVGLTRYREGLYPLEPFCPDAAARTIDQVEAYQKRFLKELGSRLVYLSDEFYLMADRPLPPYESYEGFPQIENGVGLLANMRREFDEALPSAQCASRATRSIAVGEAAYGFFCELAGEINRRFGADLRVYRVKNEFFGGQVTVSGLLCGCDLERQLKGRELGERLFVTRSMLRDGTDVLLDDVTLSQLSSSLGVPIVPVGESGYEFVEATLAP